MYERRYCSITALNRCVCPTICGWKAVDIRRPTTKSILLSRRSTYGVLRGCRTPEGLCLSVLEHWQSWQFRTKRSISFRIDCRKYSCWTSSNVFARPRWLKAGVLWWLSTICSRSVSWFGTNILPQYGRIPCLFSHFDNVSSVCCLSPLAKAWSISAGVRSLG